MGFTQIFDEAIRGGDKKHTTIYDALMKAFRWDKEKNLQLQNERRVSFEQVITAMEQGSLLDVVGHPNREKYSSQRLFIVKLRG